MRNDIIYRVKEVMRSVTSDRRRLKELEEETGIPSGNWKNVWNGNQRPTAHMIEALARRWPQYAFWLVSGITDEAFGHTAPDTWTAGEPRSSEEVEKSALDYFQLRLFAQNSIYDNANPDGMSYPSDELDGTVRKKFSDLDYAIAKIAFDKTQAFYENKFSAYDPVNIQDLISEQLRHRLKSK